MANIANNEKSMHLTFHKIHGDGHCFYRAVMASIGNEYGIIDDFLTANNLEICDKRRYMCLRKLVAHLIQTDDRYNDIIKNMFSLYTMGWMPQSQTVAEAIVLNNNDWYEWLMNDIDYLREMFAITVESTRCFATEIEFTVLNRWLEETHNIHLINLTKDQVRYKHMLLNTLMKIDHNIDSRTLLVSTDDVHYRYVSVNYRSDFRSDSMDARVTLMDTNVLVTLLAAELDEDISSSDTDETSDEPLEPENATYSGGAYRRRQQKQTFIQSLKYKVLYRAARNLKISGLSSKTTKETLIRRIQEHIKVGK